MNEITPVGSPNPPALGRPPAAARVAVAAPASTRRSDRVELSDAALLLAKIRELPPVRQEEVDRVRQAMQDPNYDLDEQRIEGAIDGLVEDLG